MSLESLIADRPTLNATVADMEPECFFLALTLEKGDYAKLGLASHA